MYLIQQGVLSVADADDLVSHGPGLRWGVMGPSLQWHLGGGADGIKHFMEHLMEGMAAGFKDLGNPDVTPELKKTIAEGVSQMAGEHSVEQLAHEENKLLVDLIKLRAQQARVLASEAHA
jgi:3-hydroxyacyl-CoA dehydrogenase